MREILEVTIVFATGCLGGGRQPFVLRSAVQSCHAQTGHLDADCRPFSTGMRGDGVPTAPGVASISPGERTVEPKPGLESSRTRIAKTTYFDGNVLSLLQRSLDKIPRFLARSSLLARCSLIF